MIKILQALYFLSLSLWVGGLATIAFVVAPITFRTASTRTEAGQIVGRILRTFNIVEFLCAGVVLFSAATLFSLTVKRCTPCEIGRFVIIGWMVVVLLIYGLYVNPELRSLRQQVPNFDQPLDTTGEKIKERFKRLHKVSEILTGTNILLGLLLLALSAAGKN